MKAGESDCVGMGEAILAVQVNGEGAIQGAEPTFEMEFTALDSFHKFWTKRKSKFTIPAQSAIRFHCFESLILSLDYLIR